MNPEAQRLAIAQACGWRAWSRPRPFPPETLEYEWSNCNPDNQRINGWELTERKDLCDVHRLPRYLSDLNAMHTAEKILQQDIALRNSYVEILRNIDIPSTEFFRIHAAPAQRAEAFLKTIGKWKE